MNIKTPKKLIEVALPLDDINVACAREKSIRHGHPSTLHLWWARRPLAAARAVIFAQMVNDPGGERGYKAGMTKQQAAVERERLFDIIKDLVKWENTNNEIVLQRARDEIKKSWIETCALNKSHPHAAKLFNPEVLPAFHDPFAGGGAIPLEAQRLGLVAHASDLNPVAVTINKAMIEIPPRFAGRTPVGPIPKNQRQTEAAGTEDWGGAKGLAEDMRRYGAWIREHAQQRIGHLYPKVEITSQMAADRPDLKPLVGQKLTVIAWLWARTVKSPNPVFAHVDVPLASTFVLSRKAGKEAYVQPVIQGDGYRLTVKLGKPTTAAESGTKLGRGANFRCLMSDVPIDDRHIRSEFVAKRAGEQLMAIVAESERGRVYLSPTVEQEAVARQAKPTWKPEQEMEQRSSNLLSGRGYGFMYWHELFTQRQLVTLTTLGDLVQEAISHCHVEALRAGFANDSVGLDAGGIGALAYAQAVGVYLGLSTSKATMFINTLSRWRAGEGKSAPAFGRQAIAMVWDYADVNPFAGAGGDFQGIIDGSVRALLAFAPITDSSAVQSDAQSQILSANKLISTDPPYYDNIAYADLSDFFYVWLRRSLKPIYPGLYATLAVPKAEELVAAPYRHGGKVAAETFFLDGMTAAMHNLAEHAHPAFPVTIYYAFKASETSGDVGTTSTGWETFLAAVLQAGFAISGTWPMSTEGSTRLIGRGTNALASSIVLVCRKRETDAPSLSRREFIRELNTTLPIALDEMTRGGINSPVMPVDLSQAIIGPGMAIYSRYSAVLEPNGTPMSVRTALQLINRFLAEDDFDPDSQFCLHWFENFGWAEGKFGDANTLAQAKGTTVQGVTQAGVLESGGGNVRLLRWAEYPADWSPETDARMPVWEALHQLIRTLSLQGQQGAGALLARMPERQEGVRQLAYRLYTLCERKGWAEDARPYNEFVTSLEGIERAMQAAGPVNTQTQLEL